MFRAMACRGTSSPAEMQPIAAVALSRQEKRAGEKISRPPNSMLNDL